MKFLRFRAPDKKIYYGWLKEEEVGLIEGDLFSEYRRLEASFPLRSVKILEPTLPSKIICMGRNYPAHAQEQEAEIPEVPMLFMKPPSSIVPDGGRSCFHLNHGCGAGGRVGDRDRQARTLDPGRGSGKVHSGLHHRQ
jgi:2-keto-4-pentenoate hydratase/2-oxohepta-3-ene-1,7-dioic acid hydratase in catechol pathway